jgi:hypothetical protein
MTGAPGVEDDWDLAGMDVAATKMKRMTDRIAVCRQDFARLVLTGRSTALAKALGID